jgi:serine/threonine-protein kinase
MTSDAAPGPIWDSLEIALREELRPDLEIVRKIGGGGSTAVFLAREPALQRLVAIKVLRPHLTDEEKTRERFMREVRSIARISHPNVVSLFRIGTVLDGVPYVVMQYVRGESLAERLAKGGPLELEGGREVIRAIASALEAAHERGILHRDLNPTNVLLEEVTGQTYLTDFGLALLMGDAATGSSRLTTKGHVVGNLRYLSPEQIRGDEPDEKADLWGLGILAWETLVGRGPFDTGSVAEALRASLEADPPRIAEAVPGLMDAESEVIDRCLERLPSARPEAGDVAGVLSGALNVSSMPDSPRGSPPAHQAPDTDSPLILRTLGGLDLESRDGLDVQPLLRQPKRMALLVLLAHGGECGHLRRDTLVGLLWPESDQARGRQALRQSLYVIRKALGLDLFEARGDAELGIRTDVLSCDAVEFERLARTGDSEAAMRWYRGELLPGFFLNDAVEFERWLETERLRLRRLAAGCCWNLAEQNRAADDVAAAGQWARRAADLTPFDEGAVDRLIAFLDQIGDRAGALRAFDHFERRLQEEYAAEPSPETLALIERVRSRS